MSGKSTNVSGTPAFVGLDHVSFPCRDLAEGIRFYRDVLGATLGNPGVTSLIPAHRGENPGEHLHVGIDGVAA